VVKAQRDVLDHTTFADATGGRLPPISL
jgi:hypothetical protein